MSSAGLRWHDGAMSERETLFTIYEEALVTTLDPVNEEWLDPSLECLTQRRSAIVMTAYNPGTARPTYAENEAANQRMFDDLRSHGYDIWQADGFSADGTWREPGWLVWDMPVEAGIAIAAEYGQFAVYAYDVEGVRSVVACDAGGPKAC
jgi:hypothetical protein